MTRAERKAAADRFVNEVTAMIVRTKTATRDTLSPRARANHGWNRGVNVTWRLVLTYRGEMLTDVDTDNLRTTFPTRTAALAYDWRTTLAGDIYDDAIDGMGGTGLARFLEGAQ